MSRVTQSPMSLVPWWKLVLPTCILGLCHDLGGVENRDTGK